MKHKFKKGLTAEEAALLATKLDRYETLKGLSLISMLGNSSMVNASMSEEEIDEYHKLETSLEEAKIIYSTLIDEINIAYELLDADLNENSNLPSSNQHTILEISQQARNAPDDEYPSVPIAGKTKVTKVSLAKWFLEHDPEISKIFDPYGNNSKRTSESNVQAIISKNKTLLNEIAALKFENQELKNQMVLPNSVEEKSIKPKGLNDYQFPIMTKKLSAMLKAQNKYWLDYDEKNPIRQNIIAASICDDLNLTPDKGSTFNRTTAELAKAIQPDHISRK